MIIGNGLIANAFKQNTESLENCIIFASGVSNSSTSDELEYSRELNLIKSFEKTDKKFIYFSTCSIYDSTLGESMYIQHKKNIEMEIKKHFSQYLIYRLPIVVGYSKNPNTLTNFIFNSIINSRLIKVHSKACRYLIDIEDVVFLVKKTLFYEKKTINLALDNKINIHQLIKIFESILKKKVNKELINEGCCYEVDNSLIKVYIDQMNYSPNYNYDLISKYYKG